MVSVKELKRADLFFQPLKNIQKLKKYKKLQIRTSLSLLDTEERN